MKFLASLGLISLLSFSGCVSGTKEDAATSNGDKKEDCELEQDGECVEELEFGKKHQKPSTNLRKPEPRSAKA